MTKRHVFVSSQQPPIKRASFPFSESKAQHKYFFLYLEFKIYIYTIYFIGTIKKNEVANSYDFSSSFHNGIGTFRSKTC